MPWATSWAISTTDLSLTRPHVKGLSIPPRIIVAGIGTGVGKTLVSAILTLGLEADYWKPIQSGLDTPTDTQWVQAATELASRRFHPEGYRLALPASPHHAAAAEGVVIDPSRLRVPSTSRTLVIETAGGLMVPLNGRVMFIDLLEQWKFPVALVVHTYLGSINHSLLSIEALQRRGIPLAGVVVNEGGHPESVPPILAAADAPLLGHVPRLAAATPAVLRKVFQENFHWTFSTGDDNLAR